MRNKYANQVILAVILLMLAAGCSTVMVHRNPLLSTSDRFERDKHECERRAWRALRFGGNAGTGYLVMTDCLDMKGWRICNKKCQRKLEARARDG